MMLPNQYLLAFDKTSWSYILVKVVLVVLKYNLFICKFTHFLFFKQSGEPSSNVNRLD